MPGCWPMLQFIDGRRGSAAGARVLPDPAAGDASTGLLDLASCYGSSSDAERSQARHAGVQVLPDQAAGDADLRRAPVLACCCSLSSDAGAPPARHAGPSGSGCRRRGSPLAPGFGQLLRLIVRRQALPPRARGSFRIRLPATRISTGCLVVGQCCSTSTDAGAPPRARGFFRSRLLATRISTGCLVVGQCCSTSSDARRFRRGMQVRPRIDCRRYGSCPRLYLK